MKILCVVDNFPPEVNALASRTYEHAVDWVKDGHEVTVVTCCPNFPAGIPYPGYKNKLYQTENIEGIKVVRVWSYLAPNAGFIKRIVDFVSFAFIAFFFSLPVKCDVIMTSSPQFFVNFTGLFLKIFKRKPWYMEVRDLWPESIAALNFMKRGFSFRVLSGFELTFYQFCDKIIVVTKSFKSKIASRGIPDAKIRFVPNGINKMLYVPRLKDQTLIEKLNLPKDKKIIGYLGTIGEAQNLISLLPFFKNNPQYFFLIIGDGAQRNQIAATLKYEKIENVMLHQLIPKDQTPRYYSLFDLGLIPLREIEAFKEVIPSKIFELASMHIPILLIGSGESADIINAYNIGCSIKSPSPELLEAAILKLLNFVPSINQDFEKQFDRKTLALKYFN